MENTILITGNRQSGKTTCALNAARGFAELGQSVLYVTLSIGIARRLFGRYSVPKTLRFCSITQIYDVYDKKSPPDVIVLDDVGDMAGQESGDAFAHNIAKEFKCSVWATMTVE